MSDEAFRSRFHLNDADNKKKYREDHVEKFNDSVEFLQNVTGISQEDAEEKILNDLIRITFVETNLTVNGQQNAEQLFANLLLAINEEQEIPFKSAQDFENFRKTIHVDEELKNFTEQEAQLDYSSLFYISKTIPGFVYDKASGRLGLSPDADRSLLLNAPIFTDTINSSHPLKLDLSRTVDACAINACTTYPDRQQTSIHSCISPNNPRLQVETFRIEPTKLCLVDADFERAKENIDKRKSQSFEKFFAVYGNLNKEEAGEDQKEMEAADDV
ncbi:Protein CBG00055 [Caenorhabditis briggsae]|uniref:Protein CBG00055 n=1 Tax=Caenorhabditis briggsae TaxID=6238 RepID=A8WM78_CAEBR|nr:Protein CBG00055 [Caenorhabditis briggsae]CAP21582.2 Protein CBG00055 [Caenorhabditis briggsae]